MDRQTAENLLAVAYAFLQRVIGVIALALPPVVAVGDLVIDHHGLRGSISSYYYGRTGGYFVGSLCALAVFFLSYDYRPRPGYGTDNRLSNLASAAAIGVALFPTSSDGAHAAGGSKFVGLVHIISAAVLFGCLAIFSLYHFTKTNSARVPFAQAIRRSFKEPDQNIDASKRRRNQIYRACGWIIVASMALIVANNTFSWGLMFWFESCAVWAFGISWLLKSGWIPLFTDVATKQRTAAVKQATTWTP